MDQHINSVTVRIDGRIPRRVDLTTALNDKVKTHFSARTPVCARIAQGVGCELRRGIDVSQVVGIVIWGREKETYTSERRQILQRSWKVEVSMLVGHGRERWSLTGLGGGGGDDNGVLHGVVLLEGLDELSDSGTLLADGNVDAVKLLGLVITAVPPLLVEHGVQGNGGLAGLTITNDQLTLTTADGHHGVDGLKTSLYRLVDGVAGENAGGLELSTALLRCLDGALAIDGVAESVDDTAQHSLANRDIDLGMSV